MNWNEVAEDPRYAEAPPDVQHKIRESWFDKNIRSNPKFTPDLEPRIRKDLFGNVNFPDAPKQPPELRAAKGTEIDAPTKVKPIGYTLRKQDGEWTDKEPFDAAAYRTFHYGLNSMNAAISRLPAASLDLGLLPSNLFLQIIGNAKDQLKAPGWLWNNPVAKYYDRQAQAWKPEELDRTPDQYLKQGDYKGAVRSLTLQVVANSPNQIAILGAAAAGMPTVGLALMGGTSAANEMGDLRTKEQLTAAQVALTGAYNGIFESLLESMGTVGILKKWGTVLADSFGTKTATGIIRDVGKTIAYSFLGEGMEESATSIAQDFSRVATGADPKAMQGSMTRAANAFAVGAVSGATMTAPTAIGIGKASAQAKQFNDQVTNLEAEEAIREFYQKQLKDIETGLKPTVEEPTTEGVPPGSPKATEVKEELPSQEEKLALVTKPENKARMAISIETAEIVSQMEEAQSLAETFSRNKFPRWINGIDELYSNVYRLSKNLNKASGTMLYVRETIDELYNAYYKAEKELKARIKKIRGDIVILSDDIESAKESDPTKEKKLSELKTEYESLQETKSYESDRYEVSSYPSTLEELALPIIKLANDMLGVEEETVKQIAERREKLDQSLKDIANKFDALVERFTEESQKKVKEPPVNVKAPPMREKKDTIIKMHAGIIPFPTKERRQVNDTIETGEVIFTDPETQDRFKKANGQTKENLRDKIIQVYTDAKHSATRVYKDLPNDPKYAPIRRLLLRQSVSREIAQDTAIRHIDAITQSFGANKLYLFSQAVVLADLLREAEAGRPIPYGYSSYDENGNLVIDIDRLKLDKANVDERISHNPDVAQAVERRKAIWKNITDDLVTYKILSKEQLKEDYFRHQILERANAKATFGTGKKLRTPTPSYGKQRFGSAEHDHNTNYLEAEFEVMAQALADIQTAKNIDEIRNSPLNIKERLKKEAKAHNERMIDTVTVPGMTRKDGTPATVRDAIKPYNQKIGWGFSILRNNGIELDQETDNTMEELARLANEETDEPQVIAARMILKAISNRRETIKKLLGNKYKEWRDLVPETHKTWQPKEGRMFYSAHSVAARIINKVIEDVAIEGITKNDLQKIVALGGLREEFVLPVEVADTLDNLYTIKDEAFILKAAEYATTQWKKWVLFNPRRAFKYNYQNFLGDFDAVFAAQPKIIGKMAQANQELIGVFYKGQTMTPTMREFFERGGLSAQMTINEIPDINKLELFDRFKRESNTAKTLKDALGSFHKYWNTVVEFTVYRESIMRYAAYLYYRDVFLSGRTEYGASRRSEVEGLSDPLDKAAMVATDVLGDYANITALGKETRRLVAPFYSWYEINVKRYWRLTKNAMNSDDVRGVLAMTARIAGGAGRKAAFALIGLWIRMIMLTSLVALYNQIFHGEEERDLSPYDQNRMHLVLGRNKNGEVIILRGQGAFGDLMEWAGLDQATTLLREYFDGKASLADVFGKIPFVTGKIGLKPVLMKLLRGVNPLYKLPVESFTGKQVWGMSEQSGRIEDKWRNIARAVQLENEYDFVNKKPSRGYFRSLAEAFITTTDPEENAYRYIQQQKYAYKEKLGKGGSGDYYAPRSIVYREYKKALRYNDKEAARTAWNKMIKMGVTRGDLKQSLASTHPLSNLNKDEKIDFINNFLTQRDHEKLKRAYLYYQKTYRK